MKQLSIIILAVIAFSTNCMAQDRNNAAPAQLATKSKEIKSALYWQQDRKTGNRVHRVCALPMLYQDGTKPYPLSTG